MQDALTSARYSAAFCIRIHYSRVAPYGFRQEDSITMPPESVLAHAEPLPSVALDSQRLVTWLWLWQMWGAQMRCAKWPHAWPSRFVRPSMHSGAARASSALKPCRCHADPVAVQHLSN